MPAPAAAVEKAPISVPSFSDEGVIPPDSSAEEYQAARSEMRKAEIEKALQFIEVPGLSLLDICMECGFSDSRYLNKLFLQRFGCTAKEYRSRAVQGEGGPSGGEMERPAAPPVATERLWSVEQSLAWLNTHRPQPGAQTLPEA